VRFYDLCELNVKRIRTLGNNLPCSVSVIEFLRASGGKQFTFKDIELLNILNNRNKALRMVMIPRT
jgi:hypothetical protein